jgi:putative AlgH/UPF0301 family transcriptional regulator
MIDNRVGKLLIAHPRLPRADWFHKSVIYIYADNEESGTLGVAVNIPIQTLSVKELCYNKGILYPHERPLMYRGGPVSEQTILMLHTNEWYASNTTPAGPSYSLTSDNIMFDKLALDNNPVHWKMCLGLCAWRPGQLDLELAGEFPYRQENSWLIADANDRIMFELDGEKQWEAAVELSSSQMINQYF